MSRYLSQLRPNYAWVIVPVAALAMVATLPGRTHGLGMITERLLADPSLGIDRDMYGDMNAWATILGAAFCLPCGYLIDRFGLRLNLTVTVAALGAVVLWMTVLSGRWPLFIAILLTRGFGQSALSVISITMVGKWYRDRLSMPMAVYSLLLSVGFVGAAQLAKPFATAEWRTVWAGMGWLLLLVMLPVAWIFTRDPPAAESAGPVPAPSVPQAEGFTLWQAMRTSAFWVFSLGICIVAMVTSGQSLFGESILTQQDFPIAAYYNLMILTGTIGLMVKLPVGWFARRSPMGRLQAVALILMGACLFWLPLIRSNWELNLYAVGMGLSGTTMTVLFFAVWGQAFGRAHLGEIQAVAQMLTVFASAAGPKVLTACHARTGSYALVFEILAASTIVVAAASWFVWVPRPLAQSNIATETEPELQLAAQ
ncbi:MAG TPA: MFS transporter [Pirellulales bacterium]|nr:MFS transporter [Pirellulales bacterium]